MRLTSFFMPLLVFFAVCLPAAFAQQRISGAVVDEANHPLHFVNVSLPALHRGTITDENGKFDIDNLSPGMYTIEFTLIGYKKETRTIAVNGKPDYITVVMHQTVLEMPGIIVTGTPQPTDVLYSSQAVSVVEGRELDRLRGQNVIQALENSPGVTTYTTGAGIAKPVVRGLVSQRVLIISNGVRQEGQQWGDEHAPEIDAFDVDRIEVLLGPGSVLYGSDALGGVVNIIRHDLPSVDIGDPSLGGNLTLNGFTNTRHAAGDISLYGAGGIFGYRGHFSARNAGDITTPDGRLFNSGVKELTGGALAGAKGDWGAASVDYSYFGQKLQIHEDPAESPDATPYQEIQHDKVHFHGDFPTRSVRLEIDGSAQQNERKEFEEKGGEPPLHLRLRAYALDVKGHHKPFGSLFGTVGFSLNNQDNESLAEEKLIPGFSQLNLAGFIYEEAQFGRFNISAGLRYDTRNLRVDETPDLNVEAQTRKYNSISGTVGIVYRISEPIAVSLNAGRGWRSPSAFELFIDGVHEGTVQYLVGDRNLDEERSLNVDLSVRYAASRFQSELTLFRNSISGYIFASPTGDIDSASGCKKYLFRQAEATLLGAEFSLQALVTDWLILTGGVDIIRGENEDTQRPLPLMPANRLRVGARFIASSIGGILNPYVSLNVKSVSTQNRVEEYETPTGGYALFDIGAGAEIMVGSNRITMDLSVENVLNRAYRDHLNRYKAYALNPGRNIALKVSVPFTLAK